MIGTGNCPGQGSSVSLTYQNSPVDTVAQLMAEKKKVESRTTGSQESKSRAKAMTSTIKKVENQTRSTAGTTSLLTQEFTPYQPDKGEKYMSERQRAHFRTILLQWKHQLMEEVDRTMSHMQSEASHLADPSDRATLEEEFSLELRTRDRERKLIRKIDATIELIDSDNYGYCETCQVEIGIRRLEARPTASQCVDCKAIDEIRERRSMEYSPG